MNNQSIYKLHGVWAGYTELLEILGSINSVSSKDQVKLLGMYDDETQILKD